MTDAELLAAIGIPEDCPGTILSALLDAMIERWTREGIEAVQAVAREQANWTLERKNEARLVSLRQQQP